MRRGKLAEALGRRHHEWNVGIRIGELLRQIEKAGAGYMRLRPVLAATVGLVAAAARLRLQVNRRIENS
jgi:hypothetical protein